jgi:crotonobetainyl-CoA:carnitine CoA-transferase CaiB-like acyl-CoA transferase
MNPPLEGLRVVDLSTHLSGPYCSMLLADLGADVVKIERPEGDEMRQVPPFVNGESAPFMLFNRNKRSVVLDLKTAAGRQACLGLAARADVFLENFRPGVAERLGLDYATLARTNSRLVYCSISGFGQTGPWRDRGGFDLIAQAMSGLMSITGEETGQPLRIPVPISDLCAGMFAAFAVLAALQARHRTGLGQRIDHSLFEAAVSLGVYEAAGYLATGEIPPRLGPAHRGSAPYQAFRTKDGWVALGAASQGLWERLCEVLGEPTLATDPRFATNARRVEHWRQLAELLQARFEREPTEHWLRTLEAAGIPVGPVLTYDQVFAHPQTRARDMIVEVEHPRAGSVRVLGIPVKFSATPGLIRRPAPLLGQHTAEVLADLSSSGGDGR